MNRRSFVKSAAGLLLAAGAGELLLPERRVWALDRTMVGDPWLPARPWNGLMVGDEHMTMLRYRGREIEVLRGDGVTVHVITIDRPAVVVAGWEPA